MGAGDAASDDVSSLEEFGDIEEPEVASAPSAGADSIPSAPIDIGIENVVGLILGSPEFQRR